MKFDFTYNGKTIGYEIVHKDVKNINIRVRPNGKLIVSCNEKASNKEIEVLLIRKAKWIFSSIEKYRANLIEFTDTNFKLVDGESFLLLGRILRIKNIESNEFKVDYDNNYLYIHRSSQRGIKLKFNEWYSNFITNTFNDLVKKSYTKYKKYDIDEPTVIYKNMKTRWGTCNIEKKLITLNTQLIKVDPFLTEYVICHELTHLRYKNHSREFYSFLTSIVPDWKQREQILNNIFINEIGGK